MRTSAISLPVSTVDGTGAVSRRQDTVAVEEPLQIRLGNVDVAVTMRTPGHDRELAAGFLFTEGILASAAQIAAIHQPELNEVTVVPAAGAEVNFDAAERNFYLTSSCGVCGKASVEAIHALGCGLVPLGEPFPSRIIQSLPDTLRARQTTFELTGGLHAAGLFSRSGELLALYEDVGRHNAVDKLIGAELLGQRVPLTDRILVVSGRTSFELVQKAVVAGAPVLAAVGAPSSLAVEVARRFQLTLCGFVRDGRFNIYSCPERLA
jgi:FdhD protein